MHETSWDIEVLPKQTKTNVNGPICVAEENILKLHFSQFVEEVACINFIFHLQRNKDAAMKKQHKTIILEQ